MKKLILFDFDGTLADSISAFIAVFNAMAVRYKYEILDEAKAEFLRDKSARELIDYLKVPKMKIPFLIRDARSLMRKHAKTVHPIHGIKDCLQELTDKGYNLGIVTSNSEEFVLEFLKHHNLEFFKMIYCGSSIFGKSKVLQKLIRSYGLDKDNIIYIGDEVRDIEAARKIHIKVVSVSWGFNSEKALKKHQPDYLIQQPQELLQVLSRL